MDIDALVERSAELKRNLVDYATTPGFARRLDHVFDSSHSLDRGSMDDFAAAVETMLYEPGPDGREPLLDRFLRTNKALVPGDRAVYEGWRDRNVFGAFRIDGHLGARMTLRNLIDEMDYHAYATVGPEAVGEVKRGCYVVTRLVPIEGIWTVSGNVNMFSPEALPAVQKFAVSLLEQMPQLAFRNPAVAEKARETVLKHHEVFVRRSGSHVVRGTGAEAVAAYRGFLDACTSELASKGPATEGLIRTGEQLAPDGGFPPELLESGDVALYHHPVKSISFLVGYGQVEDAHRVPPADAHDASLVREYVEDPTIPPYVLEDLAARYPDTVNSTYRTALSLPHFDWDRDGDELLRRHKPDHFKDPDTPAITTIPSLLLDEYRRRGQESAEAGAVAGAGR